MVMHCVVDLVSIVGEHKGCMSGGCGESIAINFEVAFVDGLAQRNSGEGNDFRIDRGVHEDDGSGPLDEKHPQNRRDFELVRPMCLDVLGTFHIDQRTLADHLICIQCDDDDECASCVCRPMGLSRAGFELAYDEEKKLRCESQRECDGGQEFKSITQVVVRVRPPDWEKNR